MVPIMSFMIVLAIFMVLFIGLDDTRANTSKIPKVILIVIIICCSISCFIFFNWCSIDLLSHGDGFC